MTPAERKQRSNAGKAAARAAQVRLGDSYKAEMKRLGRKGGRPTHQQTLNKNNAPL